MKRSDGRILTTHVGALERPRALLDALSSDDQANAEQELRTAVSDVVRQQVQAGIDVVNDGEFGKSIWQWYVTDRLDGIERRPWEAPLFRGRDRERFPAFYAWADRSAGRSLFYADEEAPDPWLGAITTQPVCTGPISYRPDQIRRDLDNLAAAFEGLDVVEAFYPVVAPASIEVGMKNEYYQSDEDFVGALADAMKEEYRAVVEAGFVLQVDDAWIPALWDLEADLDWGDYERYCMLRIEALNHALADISEDRIRYHICWGSWHGPHATDIPLADIVHLVLQVKAQAYVIEAANVRHEHEYRVWEDVKLSDGKILVPGVVTHSTQVIEHPDVVADRIVRFAERVGRENVIAGTDCGMGARIHPELGWAKLEALAEGARLASMRLWTAS